MQKLNKTLELLDHAQQYINGVRRCYLANVPNWGYDLTRAISTLEAVEYHYERDGSGSAEKDQGLGDEES